MAHARGSPSKRRRIDSGVVSTESIAQANSTLQFFTGQRHNRWMQGYVPPASGPNGQTSTTTTTASSRAALNAISFGQNRGGSSGLAGGSSGSHSNFEGNIQRPRMESTGSDRLPASVGVNNHATSARTTPNAADNSTTMRPPAPPGLPSPAASDGSTVSPVIGVPQSAERGPGRPHQMPQCRPSSMDHGHPTPAHSSPASSGSPPHMPPPHLISAGPQQQQHQSRRTSSLSNISNATANGSPNMQLSATRPMCSGPNTAIPTRVLSQPTLPSPLAASQPTLSSPLESSIPVPRLQPLHRQAQDKWLSPKSMSQRFQDFRTHQPNHRLNTVDGGRLTLLSEAINQGDLFFIVLSQIHALTAHPNLIPHSAQGLDPRCFQYLDFLICSTTLISPVVLSWLQDFPGPIVKMYFSTQTAAIYEPVVQQVVEFLRLLPQHWDRLTMESKMRGTPPLAEDLYDILHLPSPVFHVTAFRAIARLIFDEDNFDFPEKGITILESLFKMDQLYFVQNGRRPALANKLIAYRAFLQTREAWKKHEARLRKARERQSPNSQAADPARHFAFPAAEIIAAYPQQAFIPGQVNGVDGAGAMTGIQGSISPHAHRRPTSVAVDPQAPSNAAQPYVVGQSVPCPGFLPAQQVLYDPRLFFPREHDPPRPQPTQPDPSKSALHQAHLRSPTLEPAKPDAPDSLLYRYVAGFPLSPKKLKKDVPVQTHPFHIAQDNFDRIPKTAPGKLPGERSSRSLDESSRTYRLRCAPFPPSGGFATEALWMEAENYWPEDLYLDINGTYLEPRRKLHHGRYLPIDLTTHVKVGENVITSTINRPLGDTKPFLYVIAVEMINVMSHSTLKDQIRTIPAAETKASIETSLSTDTSSTIDTADDDDIAVTSSTLTIKLFDPYTHSRIFTLPVRGAACKHRDCFDLETFLAHCRREQPGWPSVVDCWRCPLCRGDVRPQTMVMDGFLVEMRETLEAKGLLDTRAVVVERDGSWVPKVEVRRGVRSPSLEAEESKIGKGKGKLVEVVEID